MLLMLKESDDQDPYNLTFRGFDDQNPNRGKATRTKKRNQDPSQVCNKDGHFRRECLQRKTGKNKGNESNNEDLAAVSQKFEFDGAEVLSISVNGPKEEWIMDFLCTFHMITIRDFFFEYMSIDGGSVLMGNNMTCFGSIKFKMCDETIKIIVEARHI